MLQWSTELQAWALGGSIRVNTGNVIKVAHYDCF